MGVSVVVASDPSLAILLGAVMLFAACVGTYWGIARARAPFGAPESRDAHRRRELFKQKHFTNARIAVILSGGLLIIAIVYLIAVHS